MHKYINRLLIANPGQLRNIEIVRREGFFSAVHLMYWRAFTELPIVGLASLECTDDVANGALSRTATIKAQLSCSGSSVRINSVYLAECVDGSRFLVGSDRPPLPLTLKKCVVPDEASQPCQTAITVTLSDPPGILEVIG